MEYVVFILVVGGALGFLTWRYKSDSFEPNEAFNPVLVQMQAKLAAKSPAKKPVSSDFIANQLEYARAALKRQDDEAALDFCLAIAKHPQRQVAQHAYQQQRPQLFQDFVLADAYVIRSDLYHELGDLQQALADCDEAINIASTYYAAYISRSWHCVALYKLDETIAAATSAINLTHGQDIRPYLNRSLAHLISNQLDASEADLKQVQQIAPDYPSLYRQLASLAHRRGDKAATIKNAKHAIRLAREQNIGYILIISAYQLMLDWEQASQTVETALKTATEPKEVCNLYLYQASFYQRQGKYSEARLLYDRLVAEYPYEYEVYNARAWLLPQLGELEAALMDVNYVIQHHQPAHPYHYGTRGHIYFLLRNYPAALADFTKSLELFSYHQFALVGLVVTYQALGQTDDMHTTLQRLIKLDARYSTTHTLLEDFHPAQPFVEAFERALATI